MTYLIIKAAISGVLVMIIFEVARRSPGYGGLIASLPLKRRTRSPFEAPGPESIERAAMLIT